MFRGARRLVCSVCAMVVGASLLATLPGCNAVKGVGRDIEAMGQGGQDLIDGKK